MFVLHVRCIRFLNFIFSHSVINRVDYDVPCLARGRNAQMYSWCEIKINVSECLMRIMSHSIVFFLFLLINFQIIDFFYYHFHTLFMAILSIEMPPEQ